MSTPNINLYSSAEDIAKTYPWLAPMMHPFFNGGSGTNPYQSVSPNLNQQNAIQAQNKGGYGSGDGGNNISYGQNPQVTSQVVVPLQQSADAQKYQQNAQQYLTSLKEAVGQQGGLQLNPYQQQQQQQAPQQVNSQVSNPYQQQQQQITDATGKPINQMIDTSNLDPMSTDKNVQNIYAHNQAAQIIQQQNQQANDKNPYQQQTTAQQNPYDTVLKQQMAEAQRVMADEGRFKDTNPTSKANYEEAQKQYNTNLQALSGEWTKQQTARAAGATSQADRQQEQIIQNLKNTGLLDVEKIKEQGVEATARGKTQLTPAQQQALQQAQLGFNQTYEGIQGIENTAKAQGRESTDQDYINAGYLPTKTATAKQVAMQNIQQLMQKGLNYKPQGQATSVPSAQAIQFLKANPATVNHFEAKYGQGSSKQYLGA